MFANAEEQDVVEKILKTLAESAINIRLVFSLGMHGPNGNKFIMDKLNQDKAIMSM